MLKANKKFVLIFSTLILTGSLSAQVKSEKGEITFGANLMNRYIWRGSQFSTGPVIQPTIEYRKGQFSFGAWGSYAQDGSDGAEADLYISYTLARDLFTATITDYFFPADIIAINNNYFDYKKASTGHIIEGTLAYNGSDKFPVSIMTAINFWGTDQDASGNQQYSIYIEFGYALKYKKGEINLFAGLTPIDANEEKGEAGFYGDTAGFVNLGFTASKEITLTDKFSLPISASVIANPMAENLFLVFGVTL